MPLTCLSGKVGASLENSSRTATKTKGSLENTDLFFLALCVVHHFLWQFLCFHYHQAKALYQLNFPINYAQWQLIKIKNKASVTQMQDVNVKINGMLSNRNGNTLGEKNSKRNTIYSTHTH